MSNVRAILICIPNVLASAYCAITAGAIFKSGHPIAGSFVAILSLVNIAWFFYVQQKVRK